MIAVYLHSEASHLVLQLDELEAMTAGLLSMQDYIVRPIFSWYGGYRSWKVRRSLFLIYPGDLVQSSRC